MLAVSVWRTDLGLRRKTFDLRGYLTADAPLWENNVCEYTPERLVMLMRAEYTGRLYRSFSDDAGLTWSTAQPTDIPKPASKITLLKIENKTILIHNPTVSTAFCDWSKRTLLSLWVSLDATRTWSGSVRDGRELLLSARILGPSCAADLPRMRKWTGALSDENSRGGSKLSAHKPRLKHYRR